MKPSVKLWIEALRSGEYKQGKGDLYNKNTNAYCCLGVACEVYNRTHKEKVDFGEHSKSFGVLAGDLHVVREWLGLKDQAGFLTYQGRPESLTEMNDAGLDFNTIADIVETAPDLFKGE